MGSCLGKTYMVKIHGADGLKMQIGLCKTPEEMEKITVLQLKERIAQRLAKKDKRNTEKKDLNLIFKDEVLDEDSKPLSEYGIERNSVIHVATSRPRRRFEEKKDLNLIFKDEVLDEDSKPLSEYGIERNSVIHVATTPPEQGFYQFSSVIIGGAPVFWEHKTMSIQLSEWKPSWIPCSLSLNEESSEDESSIDKIGNKNDKRRMSMDRLADF